MQSHTPSLIQQLVGGLATLNRLVTCIRNEMTQGLERAAEIVATRITDARAQQLYAEQIEIHERLALLEARVALPSGDCRDRKLLN